MKEKNTNACAGNKVYVTYDIKKKTSDGKVALQPEIKEIHVSGNLRDWKVGNFEEDGRKVKGVKIAYEPSSRIIEVPENAENVHFYAGEPPVNYRHLI